MTVYYEQLLVMALFRTLYNGLYVEGIPVPTINSCPSLPYPTTPALHHAIFLLLLSTYFLISNPADVGVINTSASVSNEARN